MRFVEHDKKNSAEIVLCSYTQHYAQMPRCILHFTDKFIKNQIRRLNGLKNLSTTTWTIIT